MHRVFQTLASRLKEKSQRVDDCVVVLEKAIRQRLSEARQEWLRVAPGVARYDFQRLLGLKRATLDQRAKRFQTELSRYLADRHNRLSHLQALLRERSPLVILGRGYSITRDSAGRILRDAAAVPVGAEISVRLAQGELGATVRDKKP
jgi:exodeoxyribonuclease VII large subunit